MEGPNAEVGIGCHALLILVTGLYRAPDCRLNLMRISEEAAKLPIASEAPQDAGPQQHAYTINQTVQKLMSATRCVQGAKSNHELAVIR